MSYPHAGGLYSFFMPDVATGTANLGGSVIANVDIGATSGTAGTFTCIKSCNVKRLMFSVTNEDVAGTTTAPTVVFRKQPTPNSTASMVAVGTLTVPTGTAIGKVVYKEVDVAFAVGDNLQISWTVGVGAPTGQGVASLEAYLDPEAPGNNSDMIASA